MLLTQTSWLRMPAREAGASFEPPNGAHAVGATLLKSHKILPHPRGECDLPSTPAAKPRDLVIDTGVSSITSSDSSSPRTLKHTSRRIEALPPTPPTHSRQSSGNHSRVTSAPKYDPSIRTSDVPSVPSTPPNQTPPTPDFTPPRAIPTALRPPPSDRYPSSRNDSFMTARENQDSSDEEEFPTVRPTRNVPLPNKMTRKVVGLGMGLESDEGTTTPGGKADSQEFVVFDGEWGSTEASEVEREWDDNLMRNVTVRKRRLQMFDGAAEVVEDDIISPTSTTRVVRSLPLQERIARPRLEKDAADRTSTEQFVERIAWPPSVADDSPSTPDVRRFSEMSIRTNSTVVEAMVIDAPPLRRKTLRHTKKYTGLRDFSDQSSSAPNSVVSSQHRLVHKNSRIPDRRHRSSVSTSSSRREVLNSGAIPVVVIPERRSSTKSKSLSSSRTKRSTSLGSAPLSQSSKYNEGYRKRTQSESAGSGHSVRTIDYPPTIPARRSSLSAPTSRNTSRAPSLTAESLKAHNMMEKGHKEVPSGLIVDHDLTRPSTQHTPFSQVSYETAGTTAVVSEAMAVTLFPHQNKSVLVVQQKAPESSPTPPGPATPQPNHPMGEVDSPLRNPRAAPGPPAIKFIPPTPAGLAQEEDRQLDEPEKPKRTMSLMRRAFNRRSSEPARTGFLQRTFSLGGRPSNVQPLYPTVADQPADGSKLHPFWRPSHFWDDLDSDADDELRYPAIDNRPTPKRSLSGKLKRTFAILSIKDNEYDIHPVDRRTMRRTPSGNMRVVKRRSSSSLHDRRYDVSDRVHTIPGLGVRVEYVGWAGMKRRLSERRREQRSEKLRASISAPRGVQSGVDDVLRRRSQV